MIKKGISLKQCSAILGCIAKFSILQGTAIDLPPEPPFIRPMITRRFREKLMKN